MDNLICPYCKNELKEIPKAYKCECGLIIWKLMSGKEINLSIIEELLAEGRTPVLNGFISKNNKPFSAALVLENKKVIFDFPKSNNDSDKSSNKDSHEVKNKEDNNTVRIRAESANSGSVNVIINGPVYKKVEINFGLVGSRIAECLGMITAVKLVKYMVKNPASIKLLLSINDINLTRYLLSESTPRKAEDKAILHHLFTHLSAFAEWSAMYQRKKRSQLKGGPQARIFPKGVFPWLIADVVSGDKEIVVKLPQDPEVQHQFYASFWKAEYGEQGEFIVPATAEKAVKAWIYTVKGS